MKTVFAYHPETQEFLAEIDADPSPLEAGVWLIPRNATELAPPAPGPAEVAVFVEPEGSWQVLPDFRAVPLWDTASGLPVAVTSIGPMPPGATALSPPAMDPRWTGSAWETDESAAIRRAAELRRAEILAALVGIDGRKVRALTDALLASAPARLQALEAEAEALRAELRALPAA